MSFEELKKILLMDKPSEELRKRKSELAELIPEFLSTYDFDQKTIWHTMDVFEHTLMVVDNVKPNLNLRIAALFHDIGKPNAMTMDEEGNGHFYGHWKISEDIFQKYQNSFSLCEEDIYLIRKLIFYHDLTIDSRSFNTFLQEFDEESMELLFSLKRSDAMAHNEIFVPERLKKLEEAKREIYSIFVSRGVHRINDEIRRMKLADQSVKKVSDTHHTFEELYHERALLFAALCNSTDEFVFKSKKHADEDNDPMFPGDFIAGIITPEGFFSHHIKMAYWDYFDVPELEYAPPYDYCTNEENYNRLISLLQKEKQYQKRKNYKS